MKVRRIDLKKKILTETKKEIKQKSRPISTSRTFTIDIIYSQFWKEISALPRQHCFGKFR